MVVRAPLSPGFLSLGVSFPCGVLLEDISTVGEYLPAPLPGPDRGEGKKAGRVDGVAASSHLAARERRERVRLAAL